MDSLSSELFDPGRAGKRQRTAALQDVSRRRGARNLGRKHGGLGLKQLAVGLKSDANAIILHRYQARLQTHRAEQTALKRRETGSVRILHLDDFAPDHHTAQTAFGLYRLVLIGEFVSAHVTPPELKGWD